MVHDTRNIMTGLLSFAQVGQRRAQNEEAKELFVEIERDTLRCVEIFDHLLAAVRGTGAVELTPEPVELGPLIAATLALVQGKAHLKRITIEVDAPALEAHASPTSVLQILLNLLVNAVEATPEHGRVLVTGTALEHAVEIQVGDSGPGVADAQRARIFEPYFTTKGATGTGVGLSASRDMARQMNGEVSLGGTSSLGGAAFTLRLPRCVGDDDA
jgi:signal transduction histidine kinase